MPTSVMAKKYSICRIMEIGLAFCLSRRTDERFTGKIWLQSGLQEVSCLTELEPKISKRYEILVSGEK